MAHAGDQSPEIGSASEPGPDRRALRRGVDVPRDAPATGSGADARPVLVVEDDQDIRDVIAGVLEDEGYVVAVAGHGREALDALRRGLRPRLILLDIMMPIMSGREFRAAQLADAELAGIPVVVLTAGGRAREIAAEIGAQAYLSKPLDLAKLTELVGRGVRGA
jgi:CheY-like chemotaxis protein